MDIKEKRARQRLNSQRHREKHKDEINNKYRERYRKHYQEMRAKAREKYARNKKDRVESIIKWQRANPEKVQSAQRRRHLIQDYGITEEEYFEILSKQNNLCAICRSDSPGYKNWHIDHDHKTGEIRGILCYSCNMVLGHAKDNHEILFSAINYLSR